jgi:osmotically-inducible protein OsmY
MRNGLILAMLLTLGGGLCSAQTTTFNAYVDSDLCAHLMLGPITQERIKCSIDTNKKGSSPTLVRLSNNMVVNVNKQKMVKQLVGKLASVSGDLNEKKGKIKLASASEISASDIPAGSPGHELLDVRMHRAPDDRVYEQVRHTLAMMPYISEFDFISFTMVGDTVILTGWTVRITNRDVARRRVESVEGVAKVINNIEVLPMGSMDRQIRAQVRAKFHQFLSMYFWGSGSDIKIVVKNGDIILLGTVIRQADSDLANIQANSVPGAFSVFNMLRVEPGKTKKQKG